jgi:uncharacterized protein YndB with AHSA1/START domain
MDSKGKVVISVKTAVNSPIDKVWEFWTSPEHITKWSYASEDWHTPHAVNDLRQGGKFHSRMEAKDGSVGFDFDGIYDAVVPKEYIEYHIGDGRNVKISFRSDGNITNVIETFEAESTNPIDLQRGGWQSILDNFRKYTEAKSRKRD